MNYFKELKVCQKAIELVTNTYLKTQTFPKEEIQHIQNMIIKLQNLLENKTI